MGEVTEENIKELNKELVRIWKGYKGDKTYGVSPKQGIKAEQIKINDMTPKYYHFQDYSSLDIVFLGLNPSFSQTGYWDVVKPLKENRNEKSKKELVQIMRENESLGYQYSERSLFGVSFKFSEILKDSNRIQQFIDLDTEGREKHSYHKMIRDFCSEIDSENSLKFVQTDLLKIRGTSSKEVEKIWTEGGDEELNFIQSQINQTITFIKALKPKLIVVLNAKSAKLLLHGFSENYAKSNKELLELEVADFEYLKHQQTPFYSFKDSDIPLILWSQLSGGTTSLGQREILAYVIKNKLNEINKVISTSSVEKYNL